MGTASEVIQLEVFIHRTTIFDCHRTITSNIAPRVESTTTFNGNVTAFLHVDKAYRPHRGCSCIIIVITCITNMMLGGQAKHCPIFNNQARIRRHCQCPKCCRLHISCMIIMSRLCTIHCIRTIKRNQKRNSRFDCISSIIISPLG